MYNRWDMQGSSAAPPRASFRCSGGRSVAAAETGDDGVPALGVTTNSTLTVCTVRSLNSSVSAPKYSPGASDSSVGCTVIVRGSDEETVRLRGTRLDRKS